MTPEQNLPQGIVNIIKQVEGLSEYSPARARQILADVELSTADLEPWADFDHPKADSYGRKMVYDGGFFEVMVMSWVDGDMAAIHDHGAAEWGAVRTFGQIEHAVFATRDGVMTTRDRRSMPSGSVLAVSHELIHQMGNDGQKPYLTLHLYGCYGRDGGVTADARLYDFDEDRIQFTDGGVFFALPTNLIKRRESAPEADFSTRLRFKVELLRRLSTAHDSLSRERFGSDRERRLAQELFAPETWETLLDESGEAPTSDHDIVQQELRAAARMQSRLLRAGLVDVDFDAERLSELLALEDLDDFESGYRELLARTFSLELAAAVA